MNRDEFIIGRIEEDFKHEVESLGKINSKNFQRPKLKDRPDKPISVYYYKDGDTVRIKDFSGGVKDYGIYTIGNLISMTVKESGKEQIEEEECHKEFQERLQKVSVDLDGLSSCPKWLTDKGLKMISGVDFSAKSSDLWDTKNQQAVHGTLILFYDLKTNERVGAQVRVGPKGKKLSVSDSSFSNSVHTIQEGGIDKILKKKVVILCESWSTGLEIAEARPNDRVVCTAGQGPLLQIYAKLKQEHDVVVLALDKNKKEHQGLEKYKKTDEIISYAKDPQSNIISICPPSTSPEYFHCTDFNDISQVMGKRAFGKWFNHQVNFYLPYPCTALSFDSQNYKVLSGRDNQVYTIPSKKVLDNLYSILSPMLYSPYQTNEDFIKEFSYQIASQQRGVYHGLGIFIEGDKTILNLKGQRWVYDQSDESFRPMYEAKIKDNIYMNDTTSVSSMKKDLSTKLNFGEHLTLMTKAYREITEDKKSSFLPYLGWVMQAAYAGIINKRSHMWITGPMGHGKSVMTSTLFTKLFPDISFWTIGSTVAGLRQVSSNVDMSCPIYGVEEVAPDCKQKENVLFDLLNVARGSATNEEAVTLHGTAEQKAINSMQRFAMTFVSTVDYFDNSQDRTRFCVFTPPKINKDKSPERFQEFSDACFDAREAFLVFLAKNADKFNETFNKVHALLGDVCPDIKKYDGHQYYSVSLVVAGCILLLQEISEATLEEIMVDLPESVMGFITEQQEGVESFMTEQDDLISTILLTDIKTSHGTIPLYKYMITSSEDVKAKFGIITKHPHNELILTSFKLSKAFSNSNIVQTPLWDLRGKLKDKYTPKRSSMRIDGKPTAIYKFDIPENITKLIQKFEEEYDGDS